MSLVFGYERVSPALGDASLQREALLQAGCDLLFTDRVTGFDDPQPQLQRLMRRVSVGDTVVVWRLDKLARNLKQLIATVDGIADRGGSFRALADDLDTTSGTGVHFYDLVEVLTTFERRRTAERTKAALAAARSRGRRGGRPPVMTPDKIGRAQEMYDSRRYTINAIAQALGVTRQTIYRHLDYREHSA